MVSTGFIHFNTPNHGAYIYVSYTLAHVQKFICAISQDPENAPHKHIILYMSVL